MKRRLFLQGVGGAALAAPYLSSIAPKSARAQSEYATNLAIYFHHNGCLKANYRKDVRSGPLDLSGLSTFTNLVGLEHKMLQIRGLDLGVAGFNGVTYMGKTITFDPHDQGTGSKLTAAPYNEETPRWSQGISFDHFIAGLIQPGTDPLVFSPTGATFADIKTVVSYKVAGDGKAFSPESNPSKLYANLTGVLASGVTSPATQADAKVLRGQSILDLTREDLLRLSGKSLSAADKQRLEAWSELLVAAESVVIPAGCNTEVALALGIDEAAITAAGGSSGGGGGRPGGGFGGGGNTELQMTVGMEVMQKLAALHMLCNMNRVVLQHNQSFITYNWGGMTSTADHHGVSHRTGSAAVTGADPELYEPMIKEIDTFLGGQYAKFVKVLDSIPQGEGTTLLDYSALLWLPELGDGMAHDNQDLPITIAGSMGGFLQQGVIVDGKPASSGGGGFGGGGGGGFGSPGTPINQLYVSLAQGLGRTEVETFGMADTSDVDKGITKPGPLSVIHAT